MVVTKKVIASRAQSIVGPERVIDEDPADESIVASAMRSAREADAWNAKARPIRLQIAEPVKARIFAATVGDTDLNLESMPVAPRIQPGRTKACPPRDYDHPGYEIETGIALPSKDRDSRFSETIRGMSPGSFFLIPNPEGGEVKSSLGNWLRDLGRRIDLLLVTRRNFKHPKTGVVGLGVWCVEKAKESK